MAFAAPAWADIDATTDDHSVDVPVSWYTYTNQTPTQIGNLLSANAARLTDIEAYDGANGRFTVTMVRNTGSYAVPGWWWYYGLTGAQVSSNLSANNARLVDLEPYATASGTRFAAIMVSNTGAAARNWGWLYGVSSSQIGTYLSDSNGTANPQRLLKLKSYVESGVKKYVIISVSNTGADAKAWEYWYNLTSGGVSSRLSAFGGRAINLDRQADGTYLLVQVKNAGADNHYWRYYYGLSSLGQAIDVAGQFGARVFDVETYVSGSTRYYDALMIDNANDETRRIRTAFGTALVKSSGLPNGQWGAYLKPLAASATVSLNGSRRFEPASAIKAVHNLAVMLRVQAGTESLASPFTYYHYPSAGGGDPRYPCPNPADEVAANAVGTTLDDGKDRTLGESDNRTARGIVLRYATDPANPGPSGIAALEQVAVNNAQMMSTFMDQDRHGCGYLGSKRNQTTLADLGKLYERVDNGALLGTGALRTEYWQPMNGAAFDAAPDAFLSLFPALGTVEPDIRAVVQQEGASLGKTSTQVSDFIARMEWRIKPGAYNIACANPFTPCSAGHIEIAALAGRLMLPAKSSGVYVKRDYVFGDYAADTNICDPAAASGSTDSCAACPDCDTASARDATLRAVNKELFRSIIRTNLATF